VLDDVQRRRFLVEPAGEDAAPFLVSSLHIDLDEGAGQLFRLPRRRRFAGAQTHGDILPPRRLAGMKRDVADDSVALVEDGKHGDALRHRRHARLVRVDRRTLASRFILLLGAALACRERAGGQQCRGDETHVYSGIQGS
jgi:hypothetical protein